MGYGQSAPDDVVWVLPGDANGPHRTSLLVLPHSGGNAHGYAPWRKLLPNYVRLLVGQYPDRGARFSEPLPESMADLVEPVLACLPPETDDLVVLGHSMGSLVAYEAALALTGAGRPPRALVVSACPLTGQMGSLRRLAEAGVAAALLPSLFEEQIEHDATAIHHLYELTSERFPEALSVFPEMDEYNTGPEHYLRHIEEAKRAVDIPIIGSLNGVSRGGWIEHGRRIQEAGADALELNVYHVPTDPSETAEQVEGGPRKVFGRSRPVG